MTPLRDYLLKIRQALRGFAGIQVEQYQEQLLTATRANLRIRLRLADNSLLEISEALVAEAGAFIWLSYRYHWQDATGRLIFRYDDAPHHPEQAPTFNAGILKHCCSRPNIRHSFGGACKGTVNRAIDG